jgi:hypothetical protein
MPGYKETQVLMALAPASQTSMHAPASSALYSYSQTQKPPVERFHGASAAPFRIDHVDQRLTTEAACAAVGLAHTGQQILTLQQLGLDLYCVLW